MNIIIPVRPIDGPSLKALTSAIVQMGSIHGHRIIIVFTEPMKHDVEMAIPAIKSVTDDVLQVKMTVEPLGGPAEALNKYFQHFLQWAEDNIDEPCLWVNPGSVPISTGWATAIQDEFEVSFKRFMGSTMNTSDGDQIIGPPMVFIPKVLKITIPEWRYLGEMEWEVQWRYYIREFGLNSISISCNPDGKSKFKANVTNNPISFSQPPAYIENQPIKTDSPKDLRMTEFNDMVRSSHAKLRLSEVADRMNMPSDEVRQLAEKSNIEVNKGGWLAIA